MVNKPEERRWPKAGKSADNALTAMHSTSLLCGKEQASLSLPSVYELESMRV